MRRILVTEANKGIGLAIVAKILGEQDDTFVFLGSRDPGRASAAKDELTSDNPAWIDRIECLPLDVSSDDSVSTAAGQVATTIGGDSLHGIVNNAGTKAGDLEAVLQVNTLGVRRVSRAFLPLVHPSRGRIVNVTSASGPNFVAECSVEMQRFLTDTNIQWSSLESFINDCIATEGVEAFATKGLGDGASYGLSKACANSYTMLLARENPDLLVNACTPGFIETDMTRSMFEASDKSIGAMGMNQPEKGAETPCFLLFGEPVGTGHYYGSDSKRSPLDRYRAPGTAPYAGA